MHKPERRSVTDGIASAFGLPAQGIRPRRPSYPCRHGEPCSCGSTPEPEQPVHANRAERSRAQKGRGRQAALGAVGGQGPLMALTHRYIAVGRLNSR